eukprot:NODE_3910_length_729_cov_362.175074.p1 GENE.NODE_3910_length_729_cov_362.175074~~NODE_3910_length_729_cov_362.175074.p1  ORF type:complete len:230 (+),score=66.23 NODE_3910_length_729_cov_362.175074:3-692(+)
MGGVQSDFLQSSFGTVPLCMWSFLIHGTLVDSPGTIMNTFRSDGRAQSYIALTVFLVFIFLSALTLMNMLIGVLCEVVSSVSVQEREQAAIDRLKDTVLRALRECDQDGNKMISQRELMDVLQHKDAEHILIALDIDHGHLMDWQDMVYSTRSEIAIDEIMEMLLFSRGSTPTTYRQMAENHLLTRWTLSTKFDTLSAKMDACMASLIGQITSLRPSGYRSGCEWQMDV